MVEQPLGPLAEGMVRIAFGAAGICGSDMHYFRHARTGNFVVTAPLVLGHEIAGTLAEVNVHGTHLKVGDHVEATEGIGFEVTVDVVEQLGSTSFSTARPPVASQSLPSSGSATLDRMARYA